MDLPQKCGGMKQYSFTMDSNPAWHAYGGGLNRAAYLMMEDLNGNAHRAILVNGELMKIPNRSDFRRDCLVNLHARFGIYMRNLIIFAIILL